jgi:hypothetical protein
VQLDELRRGLTDERDRMVTADSLEGRRRTDRRVRRHRVQRAGLVVVVLVLLVGAGVVLATRGTDEQRVISGPGDVPRYLPDPMPEGTATLDEYPLAAGAPKKSTQTVVFTSDPSALPGPDSPFLLLVVIARDQPIAETATQINVGPTSATAYWTDGRHGYSVVARGVGEPAFRAAVSSVSLEPSGRVDMAAPDGFREVLREEYPGDPSTPGGISSVIGKVGYVVSFDQQLPTTSSVVRGPMFTVSLWPRSHAWALMSQPLEPTEVRGQPGYLVRIKGVAQVPGDGQETDIGVLLIWWERDDVMMSVTGSSEADARRFAASLREVDPDDWEQFAAQARPLDDGGGSIATVVTGGSAAMTATTVP